MVTLMPAPERATHARMHAYIYSPTEPLIISWSWSSMPNGLKPESSGSRHEGYTGSVSVLVLVREMLSTATSPRHKHNSALVAIASV